MNAAFWGFVALVVVVIAVVVIAMKLGAERHRSKMRQDEIEDTKRIVDNAQTIYSELDDLSDDELNQRMRRRRTNRSGRRSGS